MSTPDEKLVKDAAGLREIREERAGLLASGKPTVIDHRAAIERIDSALELIDEALGIVARHTGGGA